MKELSIEEKAKRYNEALERARKLYEQGTITESLAYIFPELAEPEDERIRKKLIKLVKMSSEVGGFALHKWEADEMLAWLEKQGEQKSTDKVEPKFKVGDWVVTDKNNLVQIKSIEGSKYVLENTMRFFVDYVDKCWRKWTIQDAKNGDVLHSTVFHNDCIFIFNGLDNWKFDEPNGDRAVATGYCCLSVSADKMEFGIQGPDCVEVNTVKPASKIQRDLLFQKMKEAGYEWDAEKKELKKIEQKPEWSEQDERKCNNIIALVEGKAIMRKDIKGLVSWLKSFKDRVQSQWKPSDEQMIAIQEAMNIVGVLTITGSKINSLYQDLKKLREE